MRIFWDYETESTVTENDLKRDYEESATKEDGGSFEDYIKDCLKNTLKEISNK